MSVSTLTVGIISDLHAYETADSGNRPSHLCLNGVDSEPTKHPFAGLHKLIADNSLSVDILLCCGDLGDKAHPAAIRYAWNAIHDLKARLGASKLFATVGNHDVDSRHKFNAFDPKGFLQSLTPSFPMETEALNDTFWSRNFALYTDNVYRVAVLNSSAFHGGGEDELKHGRISDYTLAALRLALEGVPSKPVNILLCHHHPQQHMELNLGEYDVMKSGQLLLDLLGSGAFGDWIVIHGHKHHPKLCYAAGGS
jgi:predicted MPP superfamily phosphohydrolase